MTVVSNTSPLNYLVLIDLQDVLPALFEHVLIPEAVWHELRSPVAPQPVTMFSSGVRAAPRLRPLVRYLEFDTIVPPFPSAPPS